MTARCSPQRLVVGLGLGLVLATCRPPVVSAAPPADGGRCKSAAELIQSGAGQSVLAPSNTALSTTSGSPSQPACQTAAALLERSGLLAQPVPAASVPQGATPAAELPPLPSPAVSSSVVAAPATTATFGPPASRFVLDVRVAAPADAPAPQRPLPQDQWRPRTSGPSTIAGRAVIDELSEAELAAAGSARVQLLPANVDEVEATSPPSEEPLFDTGVFRCEALFGGIPVAVRDLAPQSLSDGDVAVGLLQPLTGELSGLAPAPLELGPPLAALSEEQLPLPTPPLTPVETQPGLHAPESGISPQRREQLSNALSSLQKPLQEIKLSDDEVPRAPPDVAATMFPELTPDRIWGEPWPMSNLAQYRYIVPFCHRPLYFEQPNLERCGNACGFLTTYASAAHFFGSAVLLPVHLVLEPPCQLVPTLGDCPTGCSFSPCQTLNRCR